MIFYYIQKNNSLFKKNKWILEILIDIFEVEKFSFVYNKITLNIKYFIIWINKLLSYYSIINNCWLFLLTKNNFFNIHHWLLIHWNFLYYKQ